MRTILYQPVYINPQAYFVFPSLYHIEKGDSYVEPAVYTGQLLIDVVDGSASSVIIKDTKQVDFSDYAGKHIRISQYTDEGAVVLGEWLIPGVPIPQWFKDSIVCWYSPRKQGLTEYDVIESYAEDFSKFPWNNKTEKYTGTLTPNTLTITNVAFKSSLIYTNSKPENFKVYITGLTYDQQIIFGDDTSPYRALIVEKDGIYDVSWEGIHKSYGIFCNFVGECNIKITQLPTSKAKDFSTNGHDLFLYKFKGKLDSGIGLYHADFTEWANNNSDEVSPEQVVFTTVGTKGITLRGTKTNSINIQVKGFSDKVRYLRLGYNENGVFKEIGVFKDGIYTIPGSELETSGQLSHINCSLKDDSKVTVTQIPDYPNQLCYNGSSYGVAYGLPLLNDYTIITDRVPFDYDGAFCSKKTKEDKGAFFLEKRAADKVEYAFSFGSTTKINFVQPGITWQTANSYNGQTITKGTRKDTDFFLIGGGLYRTDSDLYTELWKGCHGDILLFNRTLTDDEITWLKETIFNNN